MKHVLAIDQGTTGTTCLVVGADGRVAGRAYREIPQHYPEPGWVEHDADDLFSLTLDAAREAIAAAGVTPVSLGITNQRETVVVWERGTGRPVARAIVWQDRRTAARCASLAPHGPEIAQQTGLVLDPYFSGTKLEWLLARDGRRERAAAGELLAGTVDSWLIWKLTGGAVHATDPTNASRTMLFDIHQRRWSDALCKMFGVPIAMLPEVRPSAGDFGRTLPALFGQALPITGVAGDQQAALFGQGCWRAGEAKNTYGTGAFLLVNAGDAAPAAGGGVLTTLACDANGAAAYAVEGAMLVAGAAVQWMRDGLGLIESAAETETLAAGTSSTGGVYFVPALTGLGAPHWEPNARGTIVGLTRGTGRAELVRAALEAMAYATRDVLALMRDRAGCALAPVLRVDGGASANGWLMQFQADVLGAAVERPEMIETTAAGAAGLAGLAAGVWPSADAFLGARRFARFEPGAGAPAAQAGAAEWARAVDTALHWARSAS